MEKKTLTPVQLWQDFDNYCTPLNVSIVGYEIVNNIAITEYYFTALTAEDGEIRVYAKSFCRPNSINNPTIMFIDEFYPDDNIENVMHFIKLGYTVVSFDYRGIDAKSNLYTHYPNSLDYGNIKNSGEHFNTAKFGIENCSIFLWSKIARRVITFIESLSACDSSRIVSIAHNTGANILWQVAGTDHRLRAIVPVYNTGFSEFNGNISNYSSLDVSAEAERTRWVIGLAVPSYAKFVTCPVLFVGASNSRDYDILSLANTINMLPIDTYRAEIITIGTDKNLDFRARSSIVSLIGNILDDKENYTSPTLTRSVSEGGLFFDISADVRFSTVLKAELHVSYGNAPSALMSWKTINVGMGMDGNGRASIKAFDLNEKITAMVTIVYSNNVILTTELDSFRPADISLGIKKSVKNNRILYERSLGTRAFYLKDKSLLIDPDTITLQSGPLDIVGITSSCKELVCYNIGDIKNKSVDNALQIDCYTPESKTFTIKLTDTNLLDYFAIISITANDEWIKLTLDAQNFKDNDSKPLRTWEFIKAFSFVDAENVIFNNIIWI